MTGQPDLIQVRARAQHVGTIGKPKKPGLEENQIPQRPQAEKFKEDVLLQERQEVDLWRNFLHEEETECKY